MDNQHSSKLMNIYQLDVQSDVVVIRLANNASLIYRETKESR